MFSFFELPATVKIPILATDLLLQWNFAEVETTADRLNLWRREIHQYPIQEQEDDVETGNVGL